MQISMKNSLANVRIQSAAFKPRKIANNTFHYLRSDGAYIIRLHTTDIIEKFPSGDIHLNTGGWQTISTKERLNRFAPCRIWAKKGIWIISYAGNEYAYADGMILHVDGTVTGADESPEINIKLRRDIVKYAKAYIKAFRAGGIPKPSSCDCWGCCMVTTTGKHPMGKKAHILDHIAEQYFVPSMLTNALEAFGASQMVKHNVACIWEDQHDKIFSNSDFIWNQIEKSIKRWCYRECGLAS